MLTQGNLVNFVDANGKNPEILGYTERGHVSRALAALVTGGGDAGEPSEFAEIHDFDYNRLPLTANCADKLRGIQPGGIGNLLLTGATGFLGIHVLREYLENYDGMAWCRSGRR